MSFLVIKRPQRVIQLNYVTKTQTLLAGKKEIGNKRHLFSPFLATNSYRLVPGVGHEVSVNGDGLAVVLVRPASVVAVDLDAEGHVSKEGHHVGLPIVERLQ